MFSIGCFEEVYNEVPCEYDVDTLYNALKPYGLFSTSAYPEGFKWKGYCDLTKVNCSSWEINLSIDSCNHLFNNERYILKIANLVFDEPKNKDINNIKFNLKQCHYTHGHKLFMYEISRSTDTSTLNESLPQSKHAKIIKKIAEGYINQPDYKVVTLLVDSLPIDPYTIASAYAKRYGYKQIELVIENTQSNICKKVEYHYGFLD